MAEVRRLLVDARPVNHPTARNRGIGRYTLGLLAGLQQAGAPVVALHETAEEAELLLAAVPELRLQRLCPASMRAASEPGTWFLATQLMLHPIPLDPVPGIITEAGLPVAAVMYDVIPERHPHLYQVRPAARAQVQLRGMLSRTLDALLAISEFAADTAAHELRFPRDRIAMIGAGVEDQFRPAAPNDDPWQRLDGLLPADGRSPVLMVAGTDPRKNTERMLAAWGLVSTAVRAAHRLVVVGAADELLRRQWQQWATDAGVAHDVCFTGGVTDEQMVALHQVAVLAVMPSTEEGFGLPVLEAAACRCPVISSNVSSLPEVLAEPAAEFDPYDERAIAAAVQLALTDADHRQVLLAAAARAVQRWTWAHTGHAVMAALSTLGPRQPRALRPPLHRLALIGRFDDSPAGLANTRLAAAIEQQPDAPEVHLLVDHAGGAAPTHAGPHRFPVRALNRFVHPSLFDHVVALADAEGPATRGCVATTEGLPPLRLDTTAGAAADEVATAHAAALLEWLAAGERRRLADPAR